MAMLQATLLQKRPPYAVTINECGALNLRLAPELLSHKRGTLLTRCRVLSLQSGGYASDVWEDMESISH